ncbi:hypothetical protein DOTSEDRAFT_152584 [Dothistroma septosporum NZE10]|uniref:GED domain-containing protein n=1 Tax=Dothistroma septosporum (strain NZE10 / CBS 128990) TaxID=675120 RepID=N1PMI1_DOTSN|nr:hypothetical protein DOTSEDRAFT_152584 [Dothistroma septosporum NZE10]
MARSKTAPADTLAEGPTSAPDTTPLEALFSDDCTALLDLVDELRAEGLDTIFELPQIVVCGDQSSGKSSVLEAITQVPFPTKENLCTRFATQIVIRRAASESIKTSIIPDADAKEAEKQRLIGFKKTISKFEDLTKLIDAATAHMGLKAPSKKDNQHAFSRHKLNIEISGPDRQALTLVDLPGWINSTTAHNTDTDKQVIREIVQDYIKQDRTIILAVISATSDLANQSILDAIKAVDPDGRRTKGIITKLDDLKAGSGLDYWLEVARNNNIALELGWHLLRNRSPEERKDSFKERNATEKAFFGARAYATLAKSAKGIEALQDELGDLVHQQIKRELPRLLRDADERYHKTIADLKQLGNQRSTPEEQKDALLSVSIDYHNIVKSAVEGNWSVHKEFFATAQADPRDNCKYLRAVVQTYQKEFALQMYQYGSTYNFVETTDATGTHSTNHRETQLNFGYGDARKRQTRITRHEAVAWVKNMHMKSKGRDLPGAFNSSLVSALFHEQTALWEEMAQDHIFNVSQACCKLIDVALKHVASPILAKNIYEHLKVDLEKQFAKAHRELRNLIQDKNEPVAIYAPDYAEAVQKRLDHKINNKLKAAELRANGIDPRQAPNAAYSVFQEQSIANMDSDTASAQKALDYMLALYQSKVTTFVENVTQQVIERNLIKHLADDTFSPKMVQVMKDDAVAELTVEPKRITKKRAELEHYKGILQKSKEAIERIVNPQKRRAEEMSGFDDIVIPDAKRPVFGK